MAGLGLGVASSAFSRTTAFCSRDKTETGRERRTKGKKDQDKCYFLNYTVGFHINGYPLADFMLSKEIGLENTEDTA